MDDFHVATLKLSYGEGLSRTYEEAAEQALCARKALITHQRKGRWRLVSCTRQPMDRIDTVWQRVT